MINKWYTNDFYEAHRGGAMRSAEIIAPLVLQFVPAHSIVDIGCGDGSWLAAFRKLGVDEILGVDGEHIDRTILQIPRDRFQPADLTKRFDFERTFDLAISLEVAEHLPAECAPNFVESLSRLAPFVLFSAAIPFQAGENHINTEWPDKWAALFERHGYVAVDFIRSRVWQNSSVDWWYAQNTLLFARASSLDNNPALRSESKRTNRDQLSLVHPRHYLYLQEGYHEVLMRTKQMAPPSGIGSASMSSSIW
jgi:SAM-dependent methyltransferase